MIEQAPVVWTRAKPAYVLGASIPLADLLSLPPDGNRYDRDERGRLILAPPDHAGHHGVPLCRTARRLGLRLDEARYDVMQERSIAFDPITSLAGTILPASHHGPKTLEPDLAVFARPLDVVTAPGGNVVLSPKGLLLVIELVSPSTWHKDLGDGSSPEQVDRWRTYLENGVPEYWVLNAGTERCGLEPRSGLFLVNDRARGTWSDVPIDDAVLARDDYRGRRPATAGRIRSIAIPGLVIDLEDIWRDATLPS